MADGSLLFDTKLSTTGLETGLSRLNKMISVGIGALAGKQILNIAKMGIDYNAQMESYQASFETMLGNAERASRHINDLKKMAAKTPFEMEDLAKGSQTLMAFGLEADKVKPTLKMLGDISLGNRERFNGLALVMGQVKAQGRLMGQDLLQMVNQGFNPLLIISESTGKSMAELRDEMAKGKISYEDVEQAMKKATSEGGRFYNGLEKQSKTMSGQLSTLKDNVKATLGELTKPAFDTIRTKYLPGLIELMKKIMNNADRIRGAIKAIGITYAVYKLNSFRRALNLAALSEKLFMGVTKEMTLATKLATIAQNIFNKAMAACGGPLGLAVLAIGAAATAWAIFSKKSKSSADDIHGNVEKVIESHEKLEQTYKNNIKSIEKKRDKEMEEVAQIKIMKDQLDSLVDANGKVKEGMEKRAAVIVDELSKSTGVHMEIVNGEIQGYKDLSKQIDEYIKKKQAEIELEAAEAKWKESKKQIEKEQESYKKLVKTLDDVIAKRKELEEKKAKGHLSYGEQYELKGYIAREERLRKEMKKSTDTIQECMKVEETYSKLRADYMAGNYDKVNKTLLEHDQVMAKVANANKKTLEKMKKDTELELKVYRQLYEETHNETFKKAMENKEKELEAIDGKLDGYVNKTKEKTPNYTKAVQDMSGAALSELMQPLSWMNVGEKNATSAADGVKNKSSDLSKAAEDAGASAANAFSSSGNWHQLGMNVSGGIAKGISDGSSAITGALGGVASAALSCAQRKFQINSPSRLFRDKIGVSLPEGSAVGVKRGTKTLINALVDMFERSYDVAKDKRAILDNMMSEELKTPESLVGNMPSIISKAWRKPMDMRKAESEPKTEVKQTININQPVRTPSETARVLRKEAVIFGLAGGKI